VFTFFYAAFAVAAMRFCWFHSRRIWAGWHDGSRYGAWRILAPVAGQPTLRAAGTLGILALLGGGTYTGLIRPHVVLRDAGFRLAEIPPNVSGVRLTMDPNSLELVDPRLRHIAKWLLSVGASVEAADVNNDGLVDLLTTNPLARPEDRIQLYLNRGNFHFERVAVPALDPLRRDPAEVGLPSGALFFDYDGDGDQDLLVLVSFGRPRLLRNLLHETGQLAFHDVTDAAGLPSYVISVAANVLDYDHDGRPDLLIANAMNPYLDQYADSTRLNIFKLPPPAFPGDRRMFHFMHNGWHNADNGGRNVLLHNRGDGTFETIDARRIGMPETHWSLAVGTGDLNGDGWTDLYIASDFGHDDLYLNEQGRHSAGR